MSNKNIYNASEGQQEIMRWRDAKREQLREMYLKDSGHPTKSLLVRIYVNLFLSVNVDNILLYL